MISSLDSPKDRYRSLGFLALSAPGENRKSASEPSAADPTNRLCPFDHSNRNRGAPANPREFSLMQISRRSRPGRVAVPWGEARGNRKQIHRAGCRDQ
jgi:hypothetical protein